MEQEWHGSFTACQGLNRFEFTTSDHRPRTLILCCDVPVVLHVVEYGFTGNQVEAMFYARRLLSWRPRPWCNDVAKCLYAGQVGLSHLFSSPAKPMQEFFAFRKPKPLSAGPEAFTWFYFGPLAVLYRLTGSWPLHHYAPEAALELIGLLSKRDFYALASKHGLIMDPYQVGVLAGTEMCEDIRLWNHLVHCTAAHGLVLNREQVQLHYQQMPDTTLARMVEAGIVLHDPAKAQVVLHWAQALLERATVALAGPCEPLEASRYSPTHQAIVDHVRANRVTFVDTDAHKALFDEVGLVFQVPICYLLASSSITAVAVPENAQRIVIAGNRAGYWRREQGCLALLLGPWLRGTRERRIRPGGVKTLPEMTMRKAKCGQVVLLEQPIAKKRRSQLADILKQMGGDMSEATTEKAKTAGIAVLFVFDEFSMEFEFYASGGVYRSPNYIHVGTREVMQWKKKQLFTDPAIRPLNACRVTLLPYLQPEHFQLVVLFGNIQMPRAW